MKNRYSINKNNQLLISSSRRKKPLLVDGEFSIDKNNRFIYWLNEPDSWRKIHALPDKIVFAGNWRLNSNYDLELHLTESEGQFQEDIVTLEGEIISAEGDALVFELKARDKEGLSHLQILKLSGFWQADEFNRLIFKLEKKETPDILVLEGAWGINQNQQITYTYQKAGLKRGDKSSYALTFFGFWRITDRDRLTYIISEGTGSKFDFRVQLESPNVYPKQGVIKYRLGVGIKELKNDNSQVISLYGVWKFSRALGLIFQMQYFKGEIHSLEFGAEVNFKRNNEIVFRLKNETDEDLGLSLTFTHRFLKQLDARAFLRLKAAQEETGVDVGVRIPF